ncbi:MAG TPA: TIGR03435 family protein [Bryobacteraceae bacterium]|nr:TIGR03435 family protein [Bryobacteraceae bacterium]
MSRLCLALLAFAAAFGQEPGAAVSFEVASVKPSPPPSTTGGMMVGCSGGPGTSRPGQYTCQNARLLDLIRTAFSLKSYQMPSDDPANGARFDINARIPGGATREQVGLMLRNLLAERFKLACHFEKKEMQGYDLVVAKGGVKMKESPPEPPQDAGAPSPAPQAVGGRTTGPDGLPTLGNRRHGSMMLSTRTFRRVMVSDATMDQILATLTFAVGKPVVDSTELKGTYDFTLTYADDSLPPPPPSGGFSPEGPSAPGSEAGVPAATESAPPLLSAVQEQMGLKLVPQKVTIDILLIDHVEKKPTEN